MKLGVFAVLLGQQSFEDACRYLAESGVQAVEIGTGGYPGKAHADPAALLADPAGIQRLQDTVATYGLEISALSCHGNPVHPQKEIADAFHKDYVDTVLLAEKLDVNRVVTFSGCPGDHPGAMYPNWVTCPWPDDFGKILEYQWNDVLIPYWDKTAAFSKEHGVEKIALEMHPGFCVYNPETLLRLRAATSPVVGANLDPSHLFWQGIDPVAAIRLLGDAIHYFHAKDTKVDEINSAQNGVLDTKHYGDEIHRGWLFRTIGYGHGFQVWNDIFSNLRMAGYDDVVSIEHEDSLMSVNEGLQKAIAFLKQAIPFEQTGGMWWA